MSLNKLLSLLFAISIVLISFSVFAKDTRSKDVQLTPESILQEIKSKGAHIAVSELYDNSSAWHSILQKIASGDRSWIEIAVALHAGSDAGSSEMLTLAVGEALENNPVNVLKIAITDFQLGTICSGPDVDDSRYDSYDLSMKAINRRINKVASINDKTLTDIGKTCIQHLEESKKGIEQFYHVKTK